MDPVTVNKKCMGSSFSIQAYPDNERQTGSRITAAINLAYAEIERVEGLLTDFRSSPFNDINDNAGIRPVKVPKEVLSLVKLSRDVSEETGGAFDITYASVGILWREAFKTGKLPLPEDIARARSLIGYDKIEINEEECEILLPEKGMRIGLGSIGKSYGVDRAYAVMSRLGVKNYFVNGAGDLRVRSADDAPRPWRVGITDPFRGDKAPCGYLEVSNGAIATSGDYERFITSKGKRHHHIIDARTGEIRSDVSSVTVTAPTATLANAYSTAVMALGQVDGERYLSGRKNARGLIITSEGKAIRCNINGRLEASILGYNEPPEDSVRPFA